MVITTFVPLSVIFDWLILLIYTADFLLSISLLKYLDFLKNKMEIEHINEEKNEDQEEGQEEGAAEHKRGR